MAIGEITDLPASVLIELGKIGRWIQAIGLIIVLWMIFQIANIVNNRIRRKKLYSIENRLETINSKLDKLLKKSK